MWRIAIRILYLGMLSATLVHAQSTPQDREQRTTTAGNQDSQLPDFPVARAGLMRSGEEFPPCPGGIAKPCALFGGMRYLSTEATQHDRSWFAAMRRPSMLAAAGILIAGSFADMRTAEMALRNPNVSSVTPLYGKHPSAARIYGTGVPLLAVQLWVQGELKKTGKGMPAFALSSITGFAHIYFACRNWGMSH